MKLKTNIDVKDLINKAAQVFEVNLEDVMSKSRRRRIVDSRRAIFYLLKTHYGISEFHQSKLLEGSRDHSTIIYLNETTDHLIEVDYDFCSKYKRFFEYVTKVEFLRPLPPQYKKWNKEKIIYKYYTDDMIARSKLRLSEKVNMLSSDYKGKVRDYMRDTVNITRTKNEFNITRDLILKILAE